MDGVLLAMTMMVGGACACVLTQRERVPLNHFLLALQPRRDPHFTNGGKDAKGKKYHFSFGTTTNNRLHTAWRTQGT